VTIASQQGQSFSGSASGSQSSAPLAFNGVVDSTGNLTGTYSFAVGAITGSGTFTGRVSGNQLQMTMTGLEDEGAGGTCNQTFAIAATLVTTAGGPSADVSITGSAAPAPVATGTRITYSLTVANAGPNDATSTIAVNPAPPGTAIVSAASSQGQCATTPGNTVCSLGTVAKGGTTTITVTANLVSVLPGSTLVDSPSVSSNLFDTNLANNSTTISTPVVGGAIIKLVWDQPPPTASNPTPAPQNLRVELTGPPSKAMATSEQAACFGCGFQRVAPQDTCTLIRINIYKSDSSPVQPIPANLFVALAPADLQATLAAAPGGSFYVITNVWQCGDTIIESGVSNQASVPAGPTVTNLKVTAKLKGLGSGFADGVQVFVNGVGFARQAVLSDSTLVIQKGPLADGTAITDVGTTGTALVTFKNPNGGLGSFTFKRP
jgi:uncharacterized repeat protein (TIGR01451 family)